MYCLKGPGDLAVERMAREELAVERRLQAMTRQELIANRICPECRGEQCEACAYTGDIVVCLVCGEIMAPGTETRVPSNPDKPSEVDELCPTCFGELKKSA